MRVGMAMRERRTRHGHEADIGIGAETGSVAFVSPAIAIVVEGVGDGAGFEAGVRVGTCLLDRVSHTVFAHVTSTFHACPGTC